MVDTETQGSLLTGKEPVCCTIGKNKTLATNMRNASVLGQHNRGRVTCELPLWGNAGGSCRVGSLRPLDN